MPGRQITLLTARTTGHARRLRPEWDRFVLAKEAEDTAATGIWAESAKRKGDGPPYMKTGI